MKVIFCSCRNPHFITITKYIEKALKILGYQVSFFDDRQFIVPGRLRERVSSLHQLDIGRLNRQFLQSVSDFAPDVCLVAGGHRILPETIEKIKSRHIKTALWTIDPPVNFRPVMQAAPHYDFVFCGGTEAIEVLRKQGLRDTHWLPFACDPGIHRQVDLSPEEKEKYGNDIVFVGSFYPNRAEILESLLDFNLGIWGPGWKKIPPSHSLRRHIRGGQVKPEKWIKIYSAAKIILIIHYRDEKIPSYQASPKVYEALACKTFVLVDNQRDVFELFKDGEHLAGFYGRDDLRDKIKYYLEHPAEREKIAHKGYEEVLQAHTYEHRIKKMIEIIEKR